MYSCAFVQKHYPHTSGGDIYIAHFILNLDINVK